MSQWLEPLYAELKAAKISQDLFRDTITRLLEAGAICRGDSQIETQHYEVALQMQHLIEDLMHLLGCRLFHDRTFEYFRLYPPGAQTPVLPDDETESSAFRLRLNQHEVAAALVLRFLYDKAMQEGNIDDDGEASVSTEDLHTAMQTALGRSLPQATTDRRVILQKMRRLKIIRFDPDADMDSSETWLFIRPMIQSLVHADLIAATQAALGADVAQAVPDNEPAMAEEGTD